MRRAPLFHAISARWRRSTFVRCLRAAANACAQPLTLAAAAYPGALSSFGRWCVQHGFVYIPKSVKKERMVENMDVFGFELDEADMAALDGRTVRTIAPRETIERSHSAAHTIS